MVTPSEPNQVITNQVPSPSPFFNEALPAILSANSLEATRRPFEDPNHLALQRLGCQLLIRTMMREILIPYQYFQSLSRHKVFSMPCTTQLVHTGSHQSSCMALAQIRTIHIPLWKSIHPVSTLKMARTSSTQFRKYSQMIHLTESASQFLTYNGHLSSPGDFFPSYLIYWIYFYPYILLPYQ
ncbi:hypothetical protein O181_127992, partial [Austropuccinia psidii MF-1]|nr:hypothetical protein [Austropuccinia psidii MF-1]